MVIEPMEEDDSFNDPVPRSVPFIRPKPSQLLPPPPPPSKQKEDSDPDSDDSFETFAPTQTTGGGSIKSSASSTQSNEIKAPSLQSSRPFPHPAPFTQLNNIPATQQFGSKPTCPPPFSQRTQISSTGVTAAPPPPFSQMMSQKVGMPFRPVMQQQQQQNGQNGMGIHSAVTNTKNGDTSQKPTTSSSQAPASPNSLARHRSANSGLRSAAMNTPSMRQPGNLMFLPRTTPPFDMNSRPATPSGDVMMLRDQLENEKRKVLRLQADFQKDVLKKEEEHVKNLLAKDAIIDRQKKDIEVLKSTMACRKPETPSSSFISKPPIIPSLSQIPTSNGPSVNTFTTSTSTSDIKKVKPKIPSAEPKSKTPRRPPYGLGHISVFRHPLKEEDEDDTFQVDASFEPSATSTPKIHGIPRTGLRRPVDLGEEGTDEHARGAPTPKRARVFVERKRRSHDEIQLEIRKIWSEIDTDSMEIYSKLFSENLNSEIKTEKMETEENQNQWIDRILMRKMKNLEFRRGKDKPEKAITGKARTRILQKAELRTIPPNKCANCLVDQKASRAAPRASEVTSSESSIKKEWEIQEIQKTELLKKEAEELRCLHYTSLIHSINRKGIQELEGSTERNQRAEQEYQKKIGEIKTRSLEEIRDEKREQWKQQMMDELREKGEMLADLEKQKEGRNEDFIWTEDECDDDWIFPEPYHHPKCSLCSDCAFRQKRQRRIAKRESEKAKIKTECLNEYGNEKREQLRNMSILTKSRIEAADQSLFRENEVFATSGTFLDEEDDEEDVDIF